eukprot:Nitzschia sp. Nitz4//scaffold24_size164493//95852//97165//NITZ4_002333-RA/size164493-processed-gene-0.234-mRNA-1//-1//CDS//3329544129//4358//frame0
MFQRLASTSSQTVAVAIGRSARRCRPNQLVSNRLSQSTSIPKVHRAFLSTKPSDTGATEDSNETKENSKEAPSPPEEEEKERFAMPDRDMELKLASMQTTIADCYKEGDFAKALKLSRDLLNETQSHFGQEHPATASAFNNIGLMQKLLGDFVEARRHYTAAMRIYAKVVGRDHASYAMTLHNLGNLNKAQVHFDTSLKATERLNLVETALEYFEEAWAIRKAELGNDHPLTIATRSSYGSTLAAQVLHQHRHVQQGSNGSKPKYVSLNPEAVTRQGWDEAEQHLRQAMEASVSNPRGKTVSNKKKKKKSPPKSGKKGEIQTLSAAAAAQNLAVFLKSRAMTSDPYDQDMLEEAKKLYEQVQQVRSQLLPSLQHPDLVATKFSLAELLEVMGDEETANTIRQEILDDYEPIVKKGEMEEASEKRQILVERTTVSKDS